MGYVKFLGRVRFIIVLAFIGIGVYLVYTMDVLVPEPLIAQMKSEGLVGLYVIGKTIGVWADSVLELLASFNIAF